MAWKKRQDPKEKGYKASSLSQDEVCEILSGNSAKIVEAPKKDSKEFWKYVGITAAVLAVLAALIVGVGMIFEKQHQKEEAEKWAKEAKQGMTYFSNEQEEAAKSETELEWVVTHSYYTNDGSLAVVFSFGNGMNKAQRVDAVGIKVKREDGTIIADGHTNTVEKNLVVPINGTNKLIVYMAPEHVKIADDPLSTLVWDVTLTYTAVG